MNVTKKMEIECKGCYYTLCSFICLTEDLSEILQFLWRHGCLRKTYSCEKCGRKCAIGDKDLFFRCNRNTLDKPVVPEKGDNLTVQSEIGLNVQQTPEIQTNTIRSIIPHHINAVHQEEFAIPQLNSSDDPHCSSSKDNANSLIVFNNDTKSHQAGLLSNKEVSDDNLSLTFIPNTMLRHNDINQGNRILAVFDDESHNSQNSEKSNSVLTTPGSNVLIIPVLQAEAEVSRLLSSEPSAKIQKKSEKTERKILKKRCNFKVSMKKGTFFEKSKLPIDTVCKFVVFWCCMKHPTQEFLRNELSLATRTVVDWSTACREICIHWAKSVSEKIGGDGVMVQIDEVKIQDSKETSQSDSGKNKFSFWGMEKDKEKGKIFIVPVPACDSWSLLTVINDWILPGSVIISNCWKAYDCLKSQEFIQQTIVQAKTFVHPQSNSGLQNFDSKEEPAVSSNSEYHMPKFGTRRSHHLGDLAEFMFKRRYSNHLERMHVFFKQISMAYPLH